jgi:hypothetical protein
MTDTTKVDLAALSGAVAGLSVLTDPSVKNDLSKPALALASALDTGIGNALLGKPLSSAGVDLAADLAGEIAGKVAEVSGEVLQDAIQSLPLIGMLVSVTVGLISAIRSASIPSDEQIGAWCQQTFNVLAPTPTGSIFAGGATVPADIFARVHSIRDAKGDSRMAYGDDFAISQIWPAGERYRSAYGMLLMQVTEGFPLDPLDFDAAAVKRIVDEYGLEFLNPKKPDPVADFRAALDAMIDFDQEVASRQWKNRFRRAQAVGLPRARRRQFRALRRAIEATYKVKGSDGGVALFVVYQDLLNAAFRRRLPGNKRALTGNYVEGLLQRCNYNLGSRYSTSFGDSMWPSGKTVELYPGRHLQHKLDAALLWSANERLPNGTGILAPSLVAAHAAIPESAVGAKAFVPPCFIPWVFAWGLVGDHVSCPRSLADLVVSQADTWQRAIEPYYQAGQAKVAQIEKLGEAHDAQPPSPDASGGSGERIATAIAKALFPPAGLWSALRRGSDGGGA